MQEQEGNGTGPHSWGVASRKNEPENLFTNLKGTRNLFLEIFIQLMVWKIGEFLSIHVGGSIWEISCDMGFCVQICGIGDSKGRLGRIDGSIWKMSVRRPPEGASNRHIWDNVSSSCQRRALPAKRTAPLVWKDTSRNCAEA